MLFRSPPGEHAARFLTGLRFFAGFFLYVFLACFLAACFFLIAFFTAGLYLTTVPPFFSLETLLPMRMILFRCRDVEMCLSRMVLRPALFTLCPNAFAMLRSCPSLRESRPWQPHLHDFERHWPQTQAHEHFICLHDGARKEKSED